MDGSHWRCRRSASLCRLLKGNSTLFGGVVSILTLTIFLPNRSLAAEPVNYAKDILPILRRHCLKCHGEDTQKADLNLQTYAAALKGGSGGAALVAGRASASLLFEAITNEDPDARMPLNSPPLAENDVELIRVWIQDGLRETAGSEVQTDKRDLTFKPVKTAAGGTELAALMPGELPVVSLPSSTRQLPIVAMDTSPHAPLVAIAGNEHVRLIHSETQKELGRLPFPEGVPHVIRFHQDGAVLLVAGGKPVQSGKVVLFDVRSGKRLGGFGDELDAVMAADLSPDQQLVALGGSGKVVKVYSTSDGKLKYKLTQHTDWITAIAFSPDGTRLATADRAGGMHLWEAGGGIILSLAEHRQAIRAIEWRSDSKLLASVGEDGLLVGWDTKDGWPAISKPNVHPPQRPPGTYGELRNGILSVCFGPNGNLLTGGRDGVMRYWDPSGNPVKSFPLSDTFPVTVRISHDGKLLIAGDALGILHFVPSP